MQKNKYILEITVFTSGAIVMIYELLGSRILAPYYGTSLFVWTGLIGIILGSLSLGYSLGGKIADRQASQKNLAMILLMAAILMTFSFMGKSFIPENINQLISNHKIASLCAATVLFAPASIWLGMVSPYAIKLKLVHLKTSGKTIGNLYALSTLGSIMGTFLSGFYLIPTFGSNQILLILIFLLLLLTILLSPKELISITSGLGCLCICLYLTDLFQIYSLSKKNLWQFDSAYNHITIFDQKEKESQKAIRSLHLGKSNSSAMYLDSDELVYDYTKYYHLASHFNPHFKRALMLGGAGYSFPKDFLKTYPEAKLNVVEIDPKVTQIAREYFHLKDHPNLIITHMDGRVYLNQSQEKYDVIFGDAFSSQFSIPYQLTTQEAIQKKHSLLNQNGVVILNIIASLEGPSSKFLRAEFATYQSVFPQVYLFPVNTTNTPQQNQNIILVALKSSQKPEFKSENKQINDFLSHLWSHEVQTNLPILTDNYAPVNSYIKHSI